MSQLQRLDFDERDEQWYITETYMDGRTQPGEPFMASGHERFPKLDQVLGRVGEKYAGSRVVDVTNHSVDWKHITIEVTPR